MYGINDDVTSKMKKIEKISIHIFTLKNRVVIVWFFSSTMTVFLFVFFGKLNNCFLYKSNITSRQFSWEKYEPRKTNSMFRQKKSKKFFPLTWKKFESFFLDSREKNLGAGWWEDGVGKGTGLYTLRFSGVYEGK